MTEENHRKGSRKKHHTGVLIAAIAVVGVMLLLVGGLFMVYDHYFRKSNFMTDPESIEYSSDILESMIASTEIDRSEESSLIALIESLSDKMNSVVIETEEDATLPDIRDANVYNLLMIGVDRRSASWNGNSDTMVVMSLNYSKKTLTLTSLMRDTAANIPGVGIRKLNHAFAVGGGPLLVETVRQNYGIPIDNYMWTDFAEMEAIINIVGGIDLFLSVSEAARAKCVISEPQVVHLNGEQAVLYARDRSSGGSDYMRTQRQRNVLLAIMNKAKSGSLGNLARIADEILPHVTHNIDPAKMLTLIADLTQIAQYTPQEQRIPYDGLYYSSNELLIPNYEETQARWRAFVY